MAAILIPLERLTSRVSLSLGHQRHLFGDAYEMRISHPRAGRKGQFLYKESVRVLGSKEASADLPIFGPPWEETCVELTSEDAKRLGISSSATLQGPAGVVRLKNGVVTPASSLYCSPEEAKELHLHHGAYVELCLLDQPTVVFEEVEVRVHPTYTLLAEIYLVDSRASEIRSGAMAQLVIS